MSRLIELKNSQEGLVFCKWLYNRLIVNNKNVLGANLGSTGSGKSYRDLRMAELWYEYYFKEPFPPKNICFTIGSVMDRLNSKELRRGEILIFEESGVNLGNLDFQNKVSKMFTYILQSFRSMNIAVFFNLPYLSMLNKTARMLLHYSFESAGIDFNEKVNKCKPKFHQVNQMTGKIYAKYPRVTINHKTISIERFNFSMPSQELQDAYERKKAQYLANITEEFTFKIKEIEKEDRLKSARKELSPLQLLVFEEDCKGTPVPEMKNKYNTGSRNISQARRGYKDKGYSIKNNSKMQGNSVISISKPAQPPF